MIKNPLPPNPPPSDPPPHPGYTPPEPAKPIETSKTFWAAIATAVVSLLGGTTGQEWIREYPWLFAVGGGIVAGVMIWMRIITDRPVHVGKLMEIILGQR